MNALDRLRDRLKVGTELNCVTNTYLPARDGLTATITFVGKSFAHGRGRDGICHWAIPRRARDVEWLDDDTVRWALDGPGSEDPKLAGHTVTYRIKSDVA